MDDVAEAARVGKGTLYRYFPSKEDLYLGVVAEAFDLLIRRLERVEAEELPAGRRARADDRGDRGDLRPPPPLLPADAAGRGAAVPPQEAGRPGAPGAHRRRAGPGPRARGPDGGLPEGGPRPGAVDADRARVGHDAQPRGRHAGRDARPAGRGPLPPRDPPASRGARSDGLRPAPSRVAGPAGPPRRGGGARRLPPPGPAGPGRPAPEPRDPGRRRPAGAPGARGDALLHGRRATRTGRPPSSPRPRATSGRSTPSGASS